MARYNKSPADPRGPHIRMYWEIVDSAAWRSLTAADQRTYLALRRDLLSFNNGDLALPFTVAVHRGIRNEGTLAKSLRALVAVGLIAVTRTGGSTKGGQRIPTLYRFCDEVAHAHPKKFIEPSKATNDWKLVQTIAQGEALIRQAEEKLAARRQAAKPAAPTAGAPVE
jgi:hypothetical protein